MSSQLDMPIFTLPQTSLSWMDLAEAADVFKQIIVLANVQMRRLMSRKLCIFITLKSASILTKSASRQNSVITQ